MSTRTLAACVIATMAILMLTMALASIGAPILRNWGTPIGVVHLLDLVGIALGMFFAGFIALVDFRRWAAALAVLIWTIRFAASAAVAPRMGELSLGDALFNDWLTLPLGVVVAWYAAQAGQRVAAARRARASTPVRRARPASSRPRVPR